MPAESIAWVDSEGAASLSNGKPTPATRFGNWTPERVPVGPSKTRLGSGKSDRFEFRRDDLFSFEIAAIPGTPTNLELALRLQYHLRNGGICTLTTTRPLADQFAAYCLAENGDATIDFSDRENLEYTFSTTLNGLAEDELDDDVDILTPVLPSLILWLGPEALASAGAIDGATADIWPDVSGYDNDALQATGSKRPTYREAVCNGYGAMEFDFANGDYMLTPELIDPSTGSFVVLVGKQLTHVEHHNWLGFADSTGNGASNSRVVSTNSGDTRDHRYLTYATGGPASDWWLNDPPTTTGFTDDPAGPFVTDWFIAAFAIESTTVITPYFNSVTAAPNFAPDISIGKMTRIMVGRDNISSGNTGNNQIVDVMMYDDPLNTVERSRVIRAVAALRGITLV